MSVDFNFADIIKLPIRIIAAIAIGTGLILFLPDSIIDRLFLLSFRDSFGFVIGLVFIVSVSIVSIAFIILVYLFLKKKWDFVIKMRKHYRCVRNLDDY